MKLSRRSVMRIFGTAAIASVVPKLPELEPIVTTWDGEPAGNLLLTPADIMREAFTIARAKSAAHIGRANSMYNAKLDRVGKE